MEKVTAKKNISVSTFLKTKALQKILPTPLNLEGYNDVLEIGQGMVTKNICWTIINTYVIEIDTRISNVTWIKIIPN
jgi:16S rRNA (adenine1518-N6/adenine1519-N6)-dimethyltransferase